MPENKKTGFLTATLWLLGTGLFLAASFSTFERWGRDVARSNGFDGKPQFGKEAFAAIAAQVDRARMEATIRSLAAKGSRLSGSPGCDAAADELAGKLGDILGAGNVSREKFDVDNPFDLGTELSSGKSSFRVHPFWSPSTGTYQLPESGRGLGRVLPIRFGQLLKTRDLQGRSALMDLPGQDERGLLVLSAFEGGAFSENTLTISEQRLLGQLKAEGRAAVSAEEKRVLEAVAAKAQLALSEFFFKRLTQSGVQSILFRLPAGQPARVKPHTFEDRLLKNPSSIPRYLLSFENASLLQAGESVKIRQAPASLTLKESGQVLRIHPIWPNLVRTASTPAEGLEGRLVFAGNGSLEEIKGKDLSNSVVLVDFNCQYQWVGLADLGARAVLFIEPNRIIRGEAENKYLSVPANIPRFWITRKQAELLKKEEGKEIRLDAQIVWERRRAANILGRLAGTQASSTDDVPGLDQPVVIEAHYDSVSVVPDLAPGAEQASGPAALLELARVLKAHPLKKPVLFVLTAGHSQNLLGWREFLQRHFIATLGKPGKDSIKPAFVVDLDLTTHTRRLGVFFKADSYDTLPDVAHATYGNFGFAQAEACQTASKALGYGDDFFVDAINPTGGQRWHDYVPGRFALAQEATVDAGLYGVAFATPDDERMLVDTPQDLPGTMDFESLARQTRVLACTLPNTLNVDGAFSAGKVTNFWLNLKGRVVEFDPRVAYLPDRTVSGSIVYAHSKRAARSLKGVRGEYFVQAIGSGEQGGAELRIHGVPNFDWQASGDPIGHIKCEAFELDPVNGDIRYAPDLGSQGAESYALEANMESQSAGKVDEKELMLVTFPCRSLLFFDLVDPLSFKPFTSLKVLDARTDSAPLVFGTSLPVAPDFTSFVEPLAMAYAAEGSRIKATFSGAVLGQRGALLNADEANPEGSGYAVGGNSLLEFTSLRMAEDLCMLNGTRINRMKRHGISNLYLDGLHEQAVKKLAESKAALVQKDYQEALAAARASWGLAARVYPDVKSTASDVVQSAMMFLALLIPFAYLAERLLLGYAEASQQVTGGCAIFLTVFMILRSIHPAFQIALTPIMILLSFVIIALSLILSSLIASRFFTFLKETREEAHGVHQSEVSRVSLALAAFSIGVSNMRKRPLRTFLTCLTVVVLTFAVLSLTSVLQALKQRKFSLDKPALYEGLLFRDPKWETLNDPALGHLKAELSKIGRLVPRAWINPNKVEEKTGIELLYQYSHRANAVAALGLTAEEGSLSGLGKAVTAGSWFKPGDSLACILPDNLAKALGITADLVGKASVNIYGAEFTVRGIFDSKTFSAVHDLDDEELTPINAEASAQRNLAQGNHSGGEGALPQHYVHQDSGQVVILPYDTLMRLGGRLVSIAVPMDSSKRIQDSIRQLLNRLGLLVYVGLENKTYAYSAVGGTTTGGLDDLLVPVLIAALIIFSTMLGAVQERRREIGVFSSVGLAPNHVAILFLAEACVYAILGAAVGYLIGQGFSQLVSHGLIFHGLNVNYSSNAAIMAMIIVMVVVLLSTLYPASLASKLARPSQAVDFTLPPLTGDEVNLDLPFSFNARDAQAICAFLGEYFQSHAEASAGEFSTEDIRLAERAEGKGKVWELRARVWLAPYDFGVSQDLVFSMREGIGHVSSAGLLIHRLSGDQSSWHRVNSRFLKDIRKQFLIWRSLGDGSRIQYQKQAISQMKIKAVNVS